MFGINVLLYLLVEALIGARRGTFLETERRGEFGGMFTREKRSSMKVMQGIVGRSQGNLCCSFLKDD